MSAFDILQPTQKQEETITDDMVDKLLKEQNTNIHIADNRRKQLDKAEFHRLRVLCKRDLFFLCHTVLGNKRLSVNLHGDLCTHVTRTSTDRFREFLMPRGHFKSTILTIGHTIQIVLPYTDEDRKYDTEAETNPIGWPYNLGTDCRVLIAHETHESAARFLYAITKHFLSNSFLLALFPDASPEKRQNRINKLELELPRSASAAGNPEPTIDTFGVGGKSQGRHYNYIKLDDIYGEKARDSTAESETTKDWFDGIQSFFSTFREDHFDLIGTRYSLDDIYEHAHERYGSQLIRYCRRVEERDVKTGKKVAIFPEEFTPESLDILRKNRKRFSAEYENDPDDGISGFDSDWRKFFYWTGHNELVVFGENQRKIDVRDLDISILIDPGEKSGGFAVTGVDYLGRVFVLVSFRIELKPPDLTEVVFKNVIRWQPRTVAIESDLFASVYQYWWVAEMARRGVRFHITPVYTKKRSKDDRVMSLSQYMTAHKFYVNEAQQDLMDEWKRVGKSRNVHIFDALAYGPEIWRMGYAPGQRTLLNAPSVGGSQDDNRDIETGYSQVETG